MIYNRHTPAGPSPGWDAQTQNVDKTPAFANPLSQHESELNARVAAGYAELRALPVARVVLCNVSLLVPATCRRSRRSACGTADEDYQHRMAWSLAGAALLLAFGQGVATAATITVTTSNPYIARDGQCSLIEAIINANNDAATHADCPAGKAIFVRNANGRLNTHFRTFAKLTDVFLQCKIIHLAAPHERLPSLERRGEK